MTNETATIFASAIAAAITLTGLIVTKESKISEFRQAWIDGLRVDLAAYIASSYVIQGRHIVNVEEITSRMSELDARIHLRFKYNDPETKELLQSMDELEKLLRTAPDDKTFQQSIYKLREAGQHLLKNEWEKVKRGEQVYRRLLASARWAFYLAAAISMWYVYRLLVGYAWPALKMHL